MVRFDAYTATTTAARVVDLLPMLFGFSSVETVKQGRGFHTFKDRVWVEDESGDQVGAIQWGGAQGDRLMLEVKGERTPAVVERFRATYEHRCTRVDSCVDFERPGAFDELLAPMVELKARHKLYGERRGDWDQPELGRTQYLGAPTSAIRARLYEKGKQPEFRHLNRPYLARLEIQVRPAKEAKTAFSQLSAMEVWGASKWTRELAEQVLQEHLDPHPPGTVRKDSKRDVALRWMVRQYGPHLVSLQADLGSWECLGLTLREMVNASKREKL